MSVAGIAIAAAAVHDVFDAAAVAAKQSLSHRKLRPIDKNMTTFQDTEIPLVGPSVYLLLFIDPNISILSSSMQNQGRY